MVPSLSSTGRVRGKRLIYSFHARQRMAQRRISESEVQGALLNHHSHYPNEDKTESYNATVGGREIGIIVEEQPRVIIIVSTTLR